MTTLQTTEVPVLTVIDKCMAVHCAASGLCADRLQRGRRHERDRRERDLPYAITVDHGTEFTSKALDEWCYLRA